MEKNNFKRILLREMKGEVSFERCIKGVIAVSFFAFITCFFSFINYVFLFLGIVPLILQIVTVVIMRKEGIKIKDEKCILYNGILAVNISLEFCFLGIALLSYTFQGIWKYLAISIGILFYIIMIILYVNVIKCELEKKSYAGIKKANGKFSGAVCGLLGMLFAKIFLSGMSNDDLAKLLGGLAFFLSLLCSMGAGNIVKYYYIKKNKDWLMLEEPKEVKGKKNVRKK